MVASPFGKDGEPPPEAQAAARALSQAGSHAHYKALALDEALAELRKAVKAAHAAGIAREDVMALVKAHMLVKLHADVTGIAMMMISQEYGRE